MKLVATSPERSQPIKLGTKAPAFSLPDLNANTRSLADFAGKVVAIDFWATWCAPCREEMPALSKVAKDMAAKGVVVLGISVDDNEDILRNWLKDHPVDFPVMRATKATLSDYKVEAYPTLLVIDRNGAVIDTAIGRMTEAELTTRIERGLSVPYRP